MDYHFAIRFNASAATIKPMLDSGYTATDWRTIESAVAQPLYGEDFEGRWLSDTIVNKECYSRFIESADSTEALFLVIDREQNLVYGVGNGTVGGVPTSIGDDEFGTEGHNNED